MEKHPLTRNWTPPAGISKGMKKPLIQTLFTSRLCLTGMCSFPQSLQERLQFQGSHTGGDHGYEDKLPWRRNIRVTVKKGGSPAICRWSFHPKVSRVWVMTGTLHPHASIGGCISRRVHLSHPLTGSIYIHGCIHLRDMDNACMYLREQVREWTWVHL